MAGPLIVPTFYVDTAAATTYKASMYGLEKTVDSADRRKLRKAFDEVNDREFVKARYQFQRLARSNESVRPFWQSAMNLARSHADLCESWWLETINQGIDHSLSQAALRYLMPKYTPSRLAMRYTLLAEALGKEGHWSETIAQQAAILYASNPSSDLERQLGDAYWRAAEDVC